MAKVKGTTTSGFSYEVEKDALDDYELLELIGEGSPKAFPRIVTLMLGEKQKKQLMEHLRDKNGRVKASAVEHELIEILENAKLKNS